MVFLAEQTARNQQLLAHWSLLVVSQYFYYIHSQGYVLALHILVEEIVLGHGPVLLSAIHRIRHRPTQCRRSRCSEKMENQCPRHQKPEKLDTHFVKLSFLFMVLFLGKLWPLHTGFRYFLVSLRLSYCMWTEGIILSHSAPSNTIADIFFI